MQQLRLKGFMPLRFYCISTPASPRQIMATDTCGTPTICWPARLRTSPLIDWSCLLMLVCKLQVDNDFFLVPVAVRDHASDVLTTFPVENRLTGQVNPPFSLSWLVQLFHISAPLAD
jgi:hypothetical protein